MEALSQEGSFGFALQAEKGSFAQPDTWLPLVSLDAPNQHRGESLQLRKDYKMLDSADANDYESRYYLGAEWVEGQVALPFIPGALARVFSWIQDRDGNNQCKWASVLVDCIHTVKKLADVKVRKATIDLMKGEPVRCVLDLAAGGMQIAPTPLPNIPLAAPYIFREATAHIAKDGGPLTTDEACGRFRLVMDNAVDARLSNLAGVRCRGWFSRAFVDDAIYADFASGQEAALSITLARGEARAVISLPRLLYTASDLGLPGSHEKRIVEKVDFVALGSLDGLMPPVTLC